MRNLLENLYAKIIGSEGSCREFFAKCNDPSGIQYEGSSSIDEETALFKQHSEDGSDTLKYVRDNLVADRNEGTRLKGSVKLQKLRSGIIVTRPSRNETKRVSPLNNVQEEIVENFKEETQEDQYSPESPDEPVLADYNTHEHLSSHSSEIPVHYATPTDQSTSSGGDNDREWEYFSGDKSVWDKRALLRNKKRDRKFQSRVGLLDNDYTYNPAEQMNPMSSFSMYDSDIALLFEGHSKLQSNAPYMGKKKVLNKDNVKIIVKDLLDENNEM